MNEELIQKLVMKFHQFKLDNLADLQVLANAESTNAPAWMWCFISFAAVMLISFFWQSTLDYYNDDGKENILKAILQIIAFITMFGTIICGFGWGASGSYNSQDAFIWIARKA